MSELRRAAFLSYVTIFLTNVSGLLLTPIIIRYLGNAEYGLYLLVGSLAAYLGILDFGLNNSVARYVSQCVKRGDRQQEAQFLAAALVINLLANAVIVCIGFYLYFNIGAWFENTLDILARNKAQTMLAFLIANVVFTISSSLFSAICVGHQKFVFNKSVNLARYILRIVLIVVILFAGGGAVALVILDTLLSLSVLLVNGFYAVHYMKARFDFSSLNFKLIFSVLSFSTWVFLFAITGQVQWQSGQIIIGMFYGAESVAIYGIGIMLGTYYGAFSSAITSLFLPRANYMTAGGSSADEQLAEMINIGRMALLVLLLFLGGFSCFGYDFIRLWAGPSFGEAWSITMLIMLVYTIPLVQTFAHQLLEARGLVAFKAKLYLLAMLLGVVIGYILLPMHGILGMTIGLVLGWLLSIVVMNFYYQKVMGLNIRRFFIELFRGILPTFSLCLLVGVGLRIIPGGNWLVLFFQIVVFSILYILFMYRFGMNSAERNRVCRILERLRWNRV